jgi:N-acetylmuramoyl-L-alanine amidase
MDSGVEGTLTETSALLRTSFAGGLATTAALLCMNVLVFLLDGSDHSAAAQQSVVAKAQPSVPGAVASQISLLAQPNQTSVSLDLSIGVPAEVYTLANPYRVIIDLPDVTFDAKSATPDQTSAGLIAAYRVGLIAERRARVVIDTTGPVLVSRAAMTASPQGGAAVRLTVALTPTDEASFGLGTGGGLAPSGTRGLAEGAPAMKPAVTDDARAPPLSALKTSALPLIVIDPGHGGIDPGAVGPGKTTEKAVVLAVARQLETLLRAGDKYQVVLTRDGDVFIPLDQRVTLSEQANADLFISLHADAISERGLASTVRGASVYTLSERASDDQARRMAEKENASDRLAGLDQAANDRQDELKSILFDLIARETATYSQEVSQTLVSHLAKAGSVSRDPKRGAAFRVLKQASVPSVLVELGFLSNPEEEQKMAGAAWQKQMAVALHGAIDTYFARRKLGGNLTPQPMASGRVSP